MKAAENISKRKVEQGQSKTLEEVMYIDKSVLNDLIWSTASRLGEK